MGSGWCAAAIIGIGIGGTAEKPCCCQEVLMEPIDIKS